MAPPEPGKLNDVGVMAACQALEQQVLAADVLADARLQLQVWILPAQAEHPMMPGDQRCFSQTRAFNGKKCRPSKPG